MLLFHIDEKWFFSLVLRKFGKVAPFFGCQPVYNRIHHKNSVDKLLVVCAHAFAPFDNDLRKGGTAYKLKMTRCGGMVKAQKNSFKRVYRDDGTYHYPRLPENQLREKGKEYFENQEITGSKESDGKNRKFALAKWLNDDFMPDLKHLVQMVAIATGKAVHVRG